MNEMRRRRSLFFDLRGLLAVVVLVSLATHRAPVTRSLWMLGIGFLVSDLLLRFLPPDWFRNARLGHGVFLLDMAVLTVVLYSLGGGQVESLLLYYLTVFIATIGRDVRRSVAIALVVGALYVWLRLNQPGNVLADPEALMRIPLFFVTAVSCGYLAEQARVEKTRVRSLEAIQKGLRIKIEEIRDDLAESELLRAAAEASEERFRNLVQDVDAIVWEKDPRTFRFSFVSLRAEQVLGYPVDQWLSEVDFWASYIAPEDREWVLFLSRKAIAQGRDLDIEYRMLAADGRVVWLRDLLRVIRDAEGGVAQLRGVMVDITRLKRTEDTLEGLRRQNELLLNSAGEGIFGLDIEGKGTFINPAAARMLGWEKEELIGKVQHPIFHHTKPDGTPYPQEECPIYAGFKVGVVQRVADEVFWRKDGTSFPVEYVSTPMTEKGELVGAVVVFKDITERKRAEQALRESKERYQQLVELSPDAIFVQNEGRISFVNSAAMEMYRASKPQELIGKEVLSLVHPGDREVARERIRILWEEQKPVPRHEGKWLRLDGSIFDAEVVAAPFSDQGRPAAQVVVREITQRKQLEAQLCQAQKMEAVGRLAGGVAHDFNNLLTIIGGYSQLLLGRIGSRDEAREQVQEIKKAGDRAGALTRQLLAFSRRQVLAPQVFDLNAVVANLEKMLRRLIGEDIELVVKPGPALGRLKADPSQIEQVIMNLAVNARDAMPEGGKLRIETENVDLDEDFARNHHPTKVGRYVLLSVSDTGCGMDAETRAHIFEPFFTTKEKGKGTGLGLAMVYGIIKQSDGYIWVESEAGKGARFRIYLPRVGEAVKLIDAPRTEISIPRGSETILLVEDEEAVRSLVRGILKENGYSVLEATRGQEALLISDQHEGPIHLLLTDVVMPEIGGPELARHFAIVRPETKVIYMSGYTDDAILHHGGLDHGITLIEKPFTPESLAGKVREVLDRTARQ